MYVWTAWAERPWELISTFLFACRRRGDQSLPKVQESYRKNVGFSKSRDFREKCCRTPPMCIAVPSLNWRPEEVNISTTPLISIAGKAMVVGVTGLPRLGITLLTVLRDKYYKAHPEVSHHYSPELQSEKPRCSQDHLSARSFVHKLGKPPAGKCQS